jgi:hypothetical protein
MPLFDDTYRELAEKIQRTEFDHPFQIVGDAVEDAPRGIYAPSVYHQDGPDDVMIESDDWEAVSYGWTGQHGYPGPVMHSSEFVGAGIAEDLSDAERFDPGTIFVMTVVEVIADEGEEDQEPAGWIMLKYVGHDLDADPVITPEREAEARAELITKLDEMTRKASE